MAEAMQIGEEEKLEHVTCSMCKNTFTCPQELVCFHVFCKECLKTLPKVESENMQGFYCPTCSTFCILGEEKTPYMRSEFVKAFTSGEKKCGTCGKDGAVWNCEECDYIMCDDCKMHHSKMLLSKSHKVISSEKAEGQRLVINKPIVCEVHNDKFVEYYCTVCQELICSNCLAEKHAHKPNDVRKLLDASESFIPLIKEKIELIEGKNKIHQDQVSSSESRMNEVREEFDGVRVELDQARQIVMQKVSAQYVINVKLLEERKNMEIAKLKEFKEKIEYDIAENNQLVSFTKVTLQNAKGGSFLKEITHGLGRRIDEAISKKPLDNSKKIKLPRLEKNAFIHGDENLLGKIHWDHDDKRIINNNYKPVGIKLISCLAIMGILFVVIAVGIFTMQGPYLNLYSGLLNTTQANPNTDKPDIETLNTTQANPNTDKPDIETLNTTQANPDTDKSDIETLNTTQANPDTDKSDIETLNTPQANPDTDKPDIETLNTPQANPDTDKSDIEKLNTPQANSDTDKSDIETLNTQQANSDTDKSAIATLNRPQAKPDTVKPDIEMLNRPQAKLETDKPDTEMLNRPQAKQDTGKQNIETPDPSLPQDNNSNNNNQYVDTHFSSDEPIHKFKNTDSDFRHVKQNIHEVLGKLSPAATDIYTLHSDAKRMTLINDTIWIPLTCTIAVMNLHGTEVNRIYFLDYDDLCARSVLQVNESVVI